MIDSQELPEDPGQHSSAKKAKKKKQTQEEEDDEEEETEDPDDIEPALTEATEAKVPIVLPCH